MQKQCMMWTPKRQKAKAKVYYYAVNTRSEKERLMHI